jgi:hypothetical protein
MSSGFNNPLNDAVLATASLYEDPRLDEINRAGTGTTTDTGGTVDTSPDTGGTGDTGDTSLDSGETSTGSGETSTGSGETSTGSGETSTGSGETGDTSYEPAPVALWKNDGWLLFDGVNDMVNTGLSLTRLANSSFTAEAIVQYTGTVSRTWTPIFGANAHPESFFVGKRRDTDELNIHISGLASYVLSGHGLFDGQERHLALVFDDVANEIRVFVDQVLIERYTGVTGSLTTTSDLLIGGVGHNTDERWLGWIGPARVTGTALEPHQFLVSDATSEPLAPRPNTAPTVSGTPLTHLVVGNPWSFTPTASDPDGDTLTFSIAGKPDWASFNTKTGQVWGTPMAKGSYGPVTISVSDGTEAFPLRRSPFRSTNRPSVLPPFRGSRPPRAPTAAH